MPKISIIVPIYNMERYLDRCLTSLASQTLRDIEIVAVNDGSDDASLAILERYARGDPRFVVVDQPNGGVSAARNAGLAVCRGDYIGFVDPDDWADPGMYEALYRTAVKQNADIVMCGYRREYGSYAKEKLYPYPELTVYRGDEVQERVARRLLGPVGEELANPELLDAWGTVWSKLYRASLLLENGLRFTDLKRIGSNEDSLFNLEACLRASSFAFLNRPYYHYWRANEASLTARHNPKLAEQFAVLFELMRQAAANGGREREDFRAALSNRIGLSLFGLGLNIAGSGNPASLRRKYAELGKLLRIPLYREAARRLELRRCPPAWRLWMALAKRRLTLPLLVMLLLIERIRTKPTGGSRHAADSNLAGRHRDEPRRPGNDADELLPDDGQRRRSV